MVKCWRCAKDNGDGVEHCSVCRAKLELGAQPWFCRRCFRKCHHDACSKCQGTRAEGEAAARGARAASAQAASVKQGRRASRTKHAADKWKMSTLHDANTQPWNPSLEASEPYSDGSKDNANASPVAVKAQKSTPSHLWPLPPMQVDDDSATAIAPERPHSKQQKQRKPPPKTTGTAVAASGSTRKPVYRQSEHQRLAALEKLVGISLPQIGGNSIAVSQELDSALRKQKKAAAEAAAKAATAATEAAAATAVVEAAEIAIAEVVAEMVEAEAAAVVEEEAAAVAQAHFDSVTELERRIDPHDGTVATREQFEEYYGGLDEWDAAWPAEAASHEDGARDGYYEGGTDDDYYRELGAMEGGDPGGEQEDYALSGSRLRRLNPYAAEDAEEVAVFKALDGPSWGLHLADDGSNVVDACCHKQLISLYGVIPCRSRVVSVDGHSTPDRASAEAAVVAAAEAAAARAEERRQNSAGDSLEGNYYDDDVGGNGTGESEGFTVVFTRKRGPLLSELACGGFSAALKLTSYCSNSNNNSNSNSRRGFNFRESSWLEKRSIAALLAVSSPVATILGAQASPNVTVSNDLVNDGTADALDQSPAGHVAPPVIENPTMGNDPDRFTNAATDTATETRDTVDSVTQQTLSEEAANIHSNPEINGAIRSDSNAVKDAVTNNAGPAAYSISTHSAPVVSATSPARSSPPLAAVILPSSPGRRSDFSSGSAGIWSKSTTSRWVPSVPATASGSGGGGDVMAALSPTAHPPSSLVSSKSALDSSRSFSMFRPRGPSQEAADLEAKLKRQQAFTAAASRRAQIAATMPSAQIAEHWRSLQLKARADAATASRTRYAVFAHLPHPRGLAPAWAGVVYPPLVDESPVRNWVSSAIPERPVTVPPALLRARAKAQAAALREMNGSMPQVEASDSSSSSSDNKNSDSDAPVVGWNESSKSEVEVLVHKEQHTTEIGAAETAENTVVAPRRFVVDVRGASNAYQVVCECSEKRGWKLVKKKVKKLPSSTALQDDDDNDDNDDGDDGDDDDDDDDAGGSLRARAARKKSRKTKKKKRRKRRVADAGSDDDDDDDDLDMDGESSSASDDDASSDNSGSDNNSTDDDGDNDDNNDDDDSDNDSQAGSSGDKDNSNDAGAPTASAAVGKEKKPVSLHPAPPLKVKPAPQADIVWLADSHVNNLLSSNLVAYGPRRKRKADGQVRRRWVNHFPAMQQLISKAPLGRELNRIYGLLSSKHADAFSFFPRTFLLPRDEAAAVAWLTRTDATILATTTAASGTGTGKAAPAGAMSEAETAVGSIAASATDTSAAVESKDNAALPNITSAGTGAASRASSKDVKKKMKEPTRTLIVKPSHGSQGKGIHLVQDEASIKEYSFGSAARCSSGRKDDDDERYICQEYLDRPLLLRGLKFDLRLYMLVVASDEMEQPDAWLCREGLARFATVPYVAPSAANLDQSYMHLTNYSLNKDSGAYSEGEHKRPMSEVLDELVEAEGVDLGEVWDELGRMAAHTLMVVTPGLLNGRRAYAFERDRRRKQAKVLHALATAQDQAPTPATPRSHTESATSNRLRASNNDTPKRARASSKATADNNGATISLTVTAATDGKANKEASLPSEPTTQTAVIGGGAGGTANSTCKDTSAAPSASGAKAGAAGGVKTLPNCFQILGLDVMLVFDDHDSEDDNIDNSGNNNEMWDRKVSSSISSSSSSSGYSKKKEGKAKSCKVRASLLEVNSNPAMSIGHKGHRSAVDELVKTKAVSGALQLVETWDSRPHSDGAMVTSSSGLVQGQPTSNSVAASTRNTSSSSGGGGTTGPGTGAGVEQSNGSDGVSTANLRANLPPPLTVDNYWQVAAGGRWLGLQQHLPPPPPPPLMKKEFAAPAGAAPAVAATSAVTNASARAVAPVAESESTTAPTEKIGSEVTLGKEPFALELPSPKSAANACDKEASEFPPLNTTSSTASTANDSSEVFSLPPLAPSPIEEEERCGKSSSRKGSPTGSNSSTGSKKSPSRSSPRRLFHESAREESLEGEKLSSNNGFILNSSSSSNGGESKEGESQIHDNDDGKGLDERSSISEQELGAKCSDSDTTTTVTPPSPEPSCAASPPAPVHVAKPPPPRPLPTPLPPGDAEAMLVADYLMAARHMFEAFATAPKLVQGGNSALDGTGGFGGSNSGHSSRLAGLGLGDLGTTAAVAQHHGLPGGLSGFNEGLQHVINWATASSSHFLERGVVSSSSAPYDFDAGEEPRWFLTRSTFQQFGRRCLGPSSLDQQQQQQRRGGGGGVGNKSAQLSSAALDALFLAVTKRSWLAARRMGALEESMSSSSSQGAMSGGRRHMSLPHFLDALETLANTTASTSSKQQLQGSAASERLVSTTVPTAAAGGAPTAAVSSAALVSVPAAPVSTTDAPTVTTAATTAAAPVATTAVSVPTSANNTPDDVLLPANIKLPLLSSPGRPFSSTSSRPRSLSGSRPGSRSGSRPGSRSGSQSNGRPSSSFGRSSSSSSSSSSRPSSSSSSNHRQEQQRQAATLSSTQRPASAKHALRSNSASRSRPASAALGSRNHETATSAAMTCTTSTVAAPAALAALAALTNHIRNSPLAGAATAAKRSVGKGNMASTGGNAASSGGGPSVAVSAVSGACGESTPGTPAWRLHQLLSRAHARLNAAATGSGAQQL